MKRLDIKDFGKKVMGIHSDYFKISYSTDTGDRYIMGVSTKRNYKISIHKVKEDGSDNYTLWLWDMDKNYSYPMSIWKNNLSSIDRFTSYLTNILQIADSGGFNGEPGNKITLK